MDYKGSKNYKMKHKKFLLGLSQQRQFYKRRFNRLVRRMKVDEVFFYSRRKITKMTCFIVEP